MLGFQFSVKSNVFALFCFTVLLGWLENLHHILKQSEVKLKTKRDLLRCVFLCFTLLTCICFDF